MNQGLLIHPLLLLLKAGEKLRREGRAGGDNEEKIIKLTTGCVPKFELRYWDYISARTKIRVVNVPLNF